MGNIREKYTLKMTCCACPEQYDVFFGDNRVGYLRLRHGSFSVSYPHAGDEMLLLTNVEGDGAFDDDNVRDIWLDTALRLIDRRLEKETTGN